jgi:hypothetical protein
VIASSTLWWMPKTLVRPVIRKILRIRSWVQTRGVQELHLLHVHDELVEAGVHQLDQELTQARRRINVDFALDVDYLDPVLRVVIKLQVHKSSSAIWLYPQERLGSVDPRAVQGWQPRRELAPVAHSITL